MVKWLVTLVVVLVVFSLVAQRWRMRLPGDFSIPVRGRMYYIPVASTLLLSLAVWLISRVV
jgi:hypothetical protein